MLVTDEAGMENLDEWLAFVSTHLPDPVAREESGDGTVCFTGGDPGEVVVTVSPTTIGVFEYAITWNGPETAVAEPRLIGQVKWRRARNNETIRAVAALIAAARESRRAKYRQCERCDAVLPPEWMHDDDVCRTCAGQQLDIVH